MKWHQGEHNPRDVDDESGHVVAVFVDADGAAQCVRDHNEALTRASECSCYRLRDWAQATTTEWYNREPCGPNCTTRKGQPVEGRITHQECGCPIRAAHTYRRGDTGGYRLGLLYAVGEVAVVNSIMRQFTTEAEAVEYISTLIAPACRYYLDGPEDAGETEE